MSEPAPVEALLTPEEYLAAELVSDVKHEYVGGRIYAMAGASAEHGRLVTMLSMLLANHLRRGPCDVFIADMKARPKADVFYYPDIMVCCDKDDDDTYYRDRPRFVIEVMSRSTRRVDAGEKATNYWNVPSLEAYLIVEQHTLRVQVHRRGADGWVVETLTRPDDVVRLDSIGFAAPLAEIYERTEAGRRAAGGPREVA